MQWYFLLDLEKYILNLHVVSRFKRVHLSEFQNSVLNLDFFKINVKKVCRLLTINRCGIFPQNILLQFTKIQSGL